MTKCFNKNTAKRHFYNMCFFRWTEEGKKAVLSFIKGDEKGWSEYLKHRIPIDARCYSCNKKIYKNLSSCRCGDGGMYYIHNWDERLEEEWQKSRQKFKQETRRERNKSGVSVYSKSDLIKLTKIQNNCCYYCGLSTSNLQIEHLIPLSRGGNGEFENIVLACFNCNNQKATFKDSEFWGLLELKYPKKWIRERKRQAKTIIALKQKISRTANS